VEILLLVKYENKFELGGDLKKRAGRPSVDLAYRLRTRAWFNAVSQTSGMNDRELELLFGDFKYTPAFRPGLWGKYKKGTMCPRFKPSTNGRLSIVQRVEEKFPGTSDWLWLPFWDVLSRKPMGMTEIKAIYFSLSEEVCEKIIADETDEDLYETTFWRIPKNWKELFSELYEIGDLDAATAILALIKECEITQRPEEHKMALAYWGKIALKLYRYPPLAPIIPDINSVVGKHYAAMLYPDESGCYEELGVDDVMRSLEGITE